MLVHTGGVTASTFSFKYLANLSMNLDTGTSLGVTNIYYPFEFSFSRIMKLNIKILWSYTCTARESLATFSLILFDLSAVQFLV